MFHFYLIFVDSSVLRISPRYKLKTYSCVLFCPSLCTHNNFPISAVCTVALNVLAFNVQLPKGRKEKKEEGVGATGSLNPQKSLHLEGHGLATMQRGVIMMSISLHLCDHKQQSAVRTQLPDYLDQNVLFAHPGSYK